MDQKQIEKICLEEQKRLLDKYFGNLVEEAAVVRPEHIGEYTKDLPLKIEAEYRAFLEEIWTECAPDNMQGRTLVLEEQKLRELMTEKLRQHVDAAYEYATEVTLWERITQSNHVDMTYYKGLLCDYTRTLLEVMCEDFLKEITGKHIENKMFE